LQSAAFPTATEITLDGSMAAQIPEVEHRTDADRSAMTQEEIVRRLAAFATPTIYEAAGKIGDMAPDIRQIVPGVRLAGIARTVRCFPGDMTAVFRAVDGARAGDVIVIDGGGTERVTTWGGTTARAAKARGLAGCVTNGCVRDIDELIELRFPVFASGVSLRGTLKNHPGWHDIAVAVGGVAVASGDVVIGDGNGVVVVPATVAEDVCAKAELQHRIEEERDRRVAAGETLAALLRLPPLR
jgi:4-hydroxy-4-methyl-2-oxoglutarate aldolase